MNYRSLGDNLIKVDFKKDKYNGWLKKILNKFLSLIEERFNVEAQHFSFSEASPLKSPSFKSTSGLTLKKLLQKNNPLFLLEEVCCPLYEDEEIIGCIRIFNFDELSSKKKKELLEFLAWVCEEHTNIFEKLKTLQCIERKLFMDHLDCDSGQTRFLKRKTEASYKDKIDFFQKNKEKILEFSMLIKGCSEPEDAYKMAHEIHYFSNRQFFCDISQIMGKNELIDHQSLLSLSSLTLFIPEITKLSFVTQEELAKFLEKKATTHHNLSEIICGASRKFQDSWHLLSPALLKHLKVVEMVYSFNEYKDQGIFEFLSNVLENAK